MTADIRNVRYRRFFDVAAQPVPAASGVVVDARPGSIAQVTPGSPDASLAEWCGAHRDDVRALLDRAGGVRFRGFGPATMEHFRSVFEALAIEAMEYRDRSSPRSTVEERLYTSTHHPADQTIRMHCELSYSHEWPRTIAFFCRQPAESGGDTPLADTRRVLAALTPATRTRFEKAGVRYRRNLRDGIGLSWTDVFGTRSRAEVERHCAERGVEWEWRGDDLRIEWTLPAVAVHPRSGEAVWFNHAAFFHQRALDPEVQAALGDTLEALPFHTAFGDGTRSTTPPSKSSTPPGARPRLSSRGPPATSCSSTTSWSRTAACRTADRARSS